MLCDREGEAAISWVLLSNLRVPDFEAAKEKVHRYVQPALWQ